MMKNRIIETEALYLSKTKHILPGALTLLAVRNNFMKVCCNENVDYRREENDEHFSSTSEAHTIT